MGLENQIVYNLVDVLKDVQIKTGCYKGPAIQQFVFITSAQSKDKDSVTPQQMIDLTSCLKRRV